MSCRWWRTFQFDAMLTDLRWGISYWFTYGMDSRHSKFAGAADLKRCIEFHYTKASARISRCAPSGLPRKHCTDPGCCGPTSRTLRDVCRITAICQLPDVNQSRHLDQVWHRLGLRQVYQFRGRVVERRSGQDQSLC